MIYAVVLCVVVATLCGVTIAKTVSLKTHSDFMVAGRARRFAQFTLPDLLETRYNATARVMATIAIVISYTVITSYQFKGGGDILHLIFPELQRTTGMYIIAAFVIVFTAAAGMASIAYLDLVI